MSRCPDTLKYDDALSCKKTVCQSYLVIEYARIIKDHKTLQKIRANHASVNIHSLVQALIRHMVSGQ